MAPNLPFQFSGGFAMNSKKQGVLMLAQGFYSMFAQAILFPILAKRFGCLNIFKSTVIVWPVLYLVVPYTILLPRPYDLVGICFCLLWRTTAQALTFPPNNIMLTNSAPSMLVLGAINGVAGSTASLCRAFGPTITGFVHSKGLGVGVSGLSWWITGLVCALGAAESFWMSDPSINNGVTDMIDEEALDDPTIINPLSIDAAIVAATREEHHLAGDFTKLAREGIRAGHESARLRKNRCDQNLPACSSCQKAGVKCVGFDPITKRETPRTYVYYLENRVSYLESLLAENGIPCAASQDFDLGAKSSADQFQSKSPTDPRTSSNESSGMDKTSSKTFSQMRQSWGKEKDDERQLNRLVSNIGMVSVQGTSDPRYLGSTSGISFARVVFAAINSSVPAGSIRKPAEGLPKPATSANRTSVRDSFFGLQSKSAVEPAPFPDIGLGLQLVALYFEHANPQIPILHKGEFMALFHRAYAAKDHRKTARELYMLNIVFAIGAGIILEDSRSPHSAGSTFTESDAPDPGTRSSTKQHYPEEYHASAMMHLDSFLGSMPAHDEPDGFGGGLEELQAVLLLAGFALLRPVAPGLWYISGVATRLGVDLGLHHEDGTDLDESGPLDQRKCQGISKESPSKIADISTQGIDGSEKGRREFLRDLRRRLWWCVYSFDRLVSTCVGRPFGITDQVITTDFPTILNDEEITRSGFTTPAEKFGGPSYKRVSHHYFRLRLLQSEILQVLQYRQAKEVHENTSKRRNRYMHTKLSSSFLQPFGSFHAWRQDMDRRLWDWKESAPRQEDTTVQFSVEFLELNYWQAIIMLYRQGLNGLPQQTDSASPYDEIGSPTSMGSTEDIDGEDVYIKVAEAGQRVLMLYRQLHRIRLSIGKRQQAWSSFNAQSNIRKTLDDVDFTILAATSVLGDLIDKCPPAEACRDAFERMSRATVKLCLSTTGFGSQAIGPQARARRYSQGTDTGKDEQWSSLKQRQSRPSPFTTEAHLRDVTDRMERDQRTLDDGKYEPWQANAQSTIAFQPQSHQLHQSIDDASRPEQALVGFTSTQPMRPSSLPAESTADPFYPSFDPSSSELDAFLACNDGTAYDNQFGMNLGFGDEHDWSDGVQLDLFNGFFFGGTNNAGAIYDEL
ncbi:MAG: hypothetical protein Q9216_000135 [Gyalolechia sp. 2 TL-2023]